VILTRGGSANLARLAGWRIAQRVWGLLPGSVQCIASGQSPQSGRQALYLDAAFLCVVVTAAAFVVV
jgi:hypothetical protein